MFKAKKFLDDHQVPHWDNGSVNSIRRDKRCSSSHYQTKCPKCNSSGNLLGIRKSTGKANCFSCGSISTVEFIKFQLEIGWTQAKALATSYSSTAVEEVEASEKHQSLKQIAETCTLPPHKPLSNSAKKYLRGRGLDPQILIDEYRVVEGKGGEYDRRIIFPIYLDGKLVSYQGRDWTGLAFQAWKACSAEKEVYNHQTLVYGLQESKFDSLFVMEGLGDCQNFNCVELGSASCLFGIDYSREQVRALKESGKKLLICFDAEPKAQKRAQDLCADLAIHGCDVENVELNDGCDPGELEFEEVDSILEYFGF